MGLLLGSWTAGAQTNENNSWTSPSNGAWESLNWSLGVWPGMNQSILITNAGSKVVTINTNTAINYPQTLNIESLSLSMPGNATNELLMDHVGLATPLVIGVTNEGSLGVSQGTVFEMHGSALTVNGHIGVTGTFNAADGSQIIADSLGTAGTINLTNCMVFVTNVEQVQWSAVMRQHGGTNITKLLIMWDGGGCSYSMDAGYFSGAVQVNNGSFSQSGGLFYGSVSFSGQASFLFSGGLISQDGLSVQGAQGGSYMQYPTGQIFTQAGGTNLCGNVSVGMAGFGQFTFSGGLLVSSNLNVGAPEEYGYEQTFAAPTHFSQSGGVHSNATITLTGIPLTLEPFDWTARIILDPNLGRRYGVSTYNLTGGMLYSSAINLSYANFEQTGGTNQVGTISGATYSLNGGLLNAQILHNGGLNQSGGIAQLGSISNENQSLTLGGGQLSVQNVSLIDSTFQHLGGTCTISGLLTLDNGVWQEGTNGQQLGQMLLGAGTNSNILLPTNAAVLRFADCSSLNWSNSGALVILGWNGSLSGGGQHQIIFGNGGLTTQQLSQIQFYNPGGLDLWTYHARMLANGEIVPDPHAPFAGPSPIAGLSFLMTITNKISAADGKGYFLFITSDSGTNYSLIGIHNAGSGSGIYDYGRPDASNGVAVLDDASGAVGELSVAFSSTNQGEFDLEAVSPAGGTESGSFQAMASPGPVFLAERDIVFTVTDGSYPFATNGTYSLVTSPSGNAYAMGGTSTGTYLPALLNQSTAIVQMDDSVTGPSTLYLSFSSLIGWYANGTFAIVQTNGGFQVGSFYITDNSPFFNDSPALTNNWYYLSAGKGSRFGYYMLANFPYIYHEDMGWEFFWAANNSARGGYFYDYADKVWFYSEPGLFPYLYDFNLNVWVYYSPQTGYNDRYTSSPRWFYNFSTQAWGNHL